MRFLQPDLITRCFMTLVALGIGSLITGALLYAQRSVLIPQTCYSRSESVPKKNKESRKQTERRWKELANETRREAQELPPGATRDALLKRASQLDRACEVSAWLSMPGLRASR